MLAARSPRSSILALAAALGCLGAASTAAQPPRAVVLRFEGWRADEAREAVCESLAPELQLVEEAQALAAAETLGVDATTPRGMAEVVRHLEIAFVIAGAVEGRGRDARTAIVVLDADGEELARQDGPAPLDPAARAALGAAAVQAIRDAQQASVERLGPPPDPPEPLAAEPAPEPLPEPPPPRAPWRASQATILAGVRLRTADTRVTDQSGAEHFFESDPYPELELALALRPWFDAPDARRGLLLSVEGGVSVGASYAAGAETRGMTSLRFRGEVGYAQPIADVLELIGTLGAGVEGVQLDAADAFPSTLFTFARAAAGVRVRAVEELLVIEAGLGGRVGLDGAGLASAYGPGLLFGGFDAWAGLAGRVDPGFAWAARLGYVHHALGFSGGGGTHGQGISGDDRTLELRLLLGWSS